MSEQQIMAGDIVELKSGSVKLTVDSFDNTTVRCVWFNDSTKAFVYNNFSRDSLNVIRKKTKMSWRPKLTFEEYQRALKKLPDPVKYWNETRRFIFELEIFSRESLYPPLYSGKEAPTRIVSKSAYFDLIRVNNTLEWKLHNEVENPICQRCHNEHIPDQETKICKFCGVELMLDAIWRGMLKERFVL